MHFKEHFQLCLHNFSALMKQACEKWLTTQSQGRRVSTGLMGIQYIQNLHQALDIRHSPNIFSCVFRIKTTFPGIYLSFFFFFGFFMYRVLNKKMNDTFLVKNFNDKFNPKKKKYICQLGQKLKSGHRYNSWILNKTFSLLPENTVTLSTLHYSWL